MSILDDNLHERKLKRTKITDKLRNKGNYKYNLSLIHSDKPSSLIPKKRPHLSKYESNRLTHVACKFCFGTYKKELLFMHLKTCSSNSNLEKEQEEETISPEGKEIRKRILKSNSVLFWPELNCASTV
jgi:hypothetical protein